MNLRYYDDQEEQENLVQNEKQDECLQKVQSQLGTPIQNTNSIDSYLHSYFSELNISYRTSDYQGRNNLGTGLTSAFQNMAVTEPHNDDESITAQLDFFQGELDQQHQIASEIRCGQNKKSIKKLKRRFSFVSKKKNILMSQ